MKTLAGGFWDGRARQQPIPAKPALKWALNNPGITTSIPGMTTLDQLEMNLQVVKDITLTDEDKKELKLRPAGRRALLPALQRLPVAVPERAPDPRADAELYVRARLPELRRSLRPRRVDRRPHLPASCADARSRAPRASTSGRA